MVGLATPTGAIRTHLFHNSVHVWGSLRRQDTHWIWSAVGTSHKGLDQVRQGLPSLAAPSWSAGQSREPSLGPCASAAFPCGVLEGREATAQVTLLQRMREAARAADGGGGESWGPLPACSAALGRRWLPGPLREHPCCAAYAVLPEDPHTHSVTEETLGRNHSHHRSPRRHLTQPHQGRHRGHSGGPPATPPTLHLLVQGFIAGGLENG